MSPEEQDYVPGTEVIRNLVDRDESRPYGTSDPVRLTAMENALVSGRIVDLQESPVQGSFDFRHMREVHRTLFQDVYAWAGQPRRVPMTKRGTAYAEPREMNAMLRAEYARLADADSLRGIDDPQEFAERLADHWNAINHAHAFREGNTRSQTVFFQQLAAEAGHALDVSRLAPAHPLSCYQHFVDARFEYQQLRREPGGDPSEASRALVQVLSSLVSPASTIEPHTRAEEIISRDPGLLDSARMLHEEHGPQY